MIRLQSKEKQVKMPLDVGLTDKLECNMNQIDTILTLIAQRHMGIETLDTRDADDLDTHSIRVSHLREAMETAFSVGFELGQSMPESAAQEDVDPQDPLDQP